MNVLVKLVVLLALLPYAAATIIGLLFMVQL